MDYFFEFPGAFTLLPCELADTTPDVPAPLPLVLTVVAPALLALPEPEVTVVLVPALLPFAPLLPSLLLDGACEAPDDPPDAVDISEPDDL